MGKAAMCIKMLQILNSGRIYKASELADLMETNPRNIIEYRKELDEAGYTIIPIPGKYGGYQLDQTTLIPSLRLTKEEQEAFTAGVSYLDARNDFMYKNEHRKAAAKIYSSINRANHEEKTQIVERQPLSIDAAELSKRYAAVKSCIDEHRELCLSYVGLDAVEIRRTLQPYRLFEYNNAWYVVAYVVEEDDFRYFKLARFVDYQPTYKKFRQRFSYLEADYLDAYGMKKNGEWYPIRLRISGAYAVMAKEKLYGRNQVVTEIDEHTVELDCEMQNKNRILSFVLGLADNCEILEPQWLKDAVLDATRAIQAKLVEPK